MCQCTAVLSCCRYGLKGVCAYAAHAEALGVRDPEIYAGVEVMGAWRIAGLGCVCV